MHDRGRIGTENFDPPAAADFRREKAQRDILLRLGHMKPIMKRVIQFLKENPLQYCATIG